jgi:hypothetical protein
MGSSPNQDIYNFITAIKNIGAKDEDSKKNIEKIRDDLRAARESCSDLMDRSYTEAFTTESEKPKND